MRAIFYIDGFNFYYLRMRTLPAWKWLDVKKMADSLVGKNESVLEVNYYTARVSGKVDHDAHQRQAAYFRALNAIPEVNLHYGRFLFGEKWAGLVKPPRSKPDGYGWVEPSPVVVYVRKTEEKGSDVNLGAHLVRDAFMDKFDVAYVLTNDTDLVEPIRIVTEEVGKKVGIVAPCRQKNRSPVPIPSPSLAKVSSFTVYIDDKHLSGSQLADPFPTGKGKTVSKPVSWQ